nr:hypothetical protein [Tanacetum cinerariifolium]
GEGSETPTEPHHTPSLETQPSSHTHISSPTLLTVTTIPTVTPSETTSLRQYTRRARIAQFSAFPPVADEPASPMRDVSQGEACPTDSGFVADQDRANIAKTSTLPHESTSRVTSLAADEGSLQLRFQELTDFCTSLQRQQSEFVSKFAAQALEITELKARVKFLEDKQGEGINLSRVDAPIKGQRLDEDEVATKRVSSDTEQIRLDEGDVAAEKVSDDTEEMATVLITMDAAIVLSSGGVQVVPTAAAVVPANVSISTGSGVVPTASTTISTATPIFATATIVTPYTRRKGKEKMVETHTPKKKKRLQEQIDIQFTRELEEELEREAQRMNAQIARDEEIAKIHAEEELQQMIKGLDRSNETIAKHLEEFEQATAELTIGERIELISDLVKDQDRHSKILQYQAQQRNTRTKKQKRDFYMAKTSEEVPEEVKSSDEVPEEKIKELIQLVPIEEVYIEALQVKHLIIDWKEVELWVELKRLYEPDVEDHLWTHTQHIMHAPVEWRLYDTCGVHHGRIVGNKMHKAFPLPVTEFPLPEELPTAREDSCHCQKKREATARKLALLSMNYGGSRHQYSHHGTILSIVTRKQAPGMVKPEIRGNVNFEIKSQFMRELREDIFYGKNEDAHDHVDRVLNIVSLFNILGVSQDAVLLRVFPFTLTGSTKTWVDRLTPGAVNTWDLLKKAFIQRNINSNIEFDGLAAIVRPHLGKECPLNEEVKQLEEYKYGEFRRSAPFNGSASVNVMPRNTFEYLRLANIRNTNMLVEMAYMMKKEPLDVHRDSTYWWHDHRFEKEERDEMGIEIEKYDPPEVQVETFKKPSRDFTRPLGPPSGLKGLLHMLNATVIPMKTLDYAVTSFKPTRWKVRVSSLRRKPLQDHGFIGYPFKYGVTLGFGSIAGGLDHVNPIIRLPLEHGISRVLGKVDHSNPSVGTNPVTASIT